jgi:dolichol kinase
VSVAPPGALRHELARKALHLATAALPVLWAAGLLTTEALRAALGVAVAIALTIEVLRLRHARLAASFTAAVGSMLRPHEARRLTGATWLAIAMAGVVWLAPPRAALAALWAAAVGDASAAIVGRSIAAWRGHAADGKSLAGFVAALVATALGCRVLVGTTWPVAAALGAVAALAEWPRRPFDDNLRVAGAVALAAAALGLR